MTTAQLLRKAHAMAPQQHEKTRAPRSEQRQRTALIALRMLPAERDALHAAAKQRGVSISELVRASVFAEIAP
ncbi:plasmid mobilization protein [Mycobacterium marinum]|uniref:plasmid mobilization protein n=1 Tax=Mycobacterium marinum TaxID=1781 RepID=UPI002359E20C|nr:hypothetical protein [Mycobacterium marinum]MDC8973996.1 hypothetical protein [Mycobacterium marinum]